ncbi:MAG: ABC transporter permease [Dehalococcoidia bacterium]
MYGYIIRRLLLSIPTLVLVTIGSFALIRLVPGDVVLAKVGESGNTANLDKIRAELGLDQPFLVQYFRFVGGVLKGDPGNSLWSTKPVTSEFLDALPVSLELGILAMITSVIIAIPTGIVSAIRQDKIIDYVARLFAIIGTSIPDYWLATVCVVYFALWFGYLPPLGFVGPFQDPTKNLSQIYLPGLILGYRLAATTTRMVRSQMLEVLRQDYIRTAWAKGLRERSVIASHAMKNSLIPVVTIWGTQISVIFGGTVILESIFALPGVGRLTFTAIQQRDYTQIQFNVLALASIIVLVNLAVDLAYGWLDPRIRYR